MVDVIGHNRLRRHMHRAHAQCMRGGKVAGVVFEHRRLMRHQPVGGKHTFKSCAVRLGAKPRMFNAINRIKRPGQPTCGQNALGIGGSAICVNDPPPRQTGDGRTQRRILGQVI